MLQFLIILNAVHILRCHCLHRNHGEDQLIQFVQIPLFLRNVRRNTGVHAIFHTIRDHLENRIAHVLSIQYAAALLVDNLSLIVHNLIILKKILSDTEVVALNLLLRFLNRRCQHLMLDLLTFRNTECVENVHQLLRTEQTHQIVFQRNEELGLTRISLTAGTTAQLVINTSGFMSLCTDDLQTACSFRLVIQLNIGTTPCHVGRDRHRTVLSGAGYNLSLFFMELRVQYRMRNSLALQHAADQLGSIDIDGTDKYRLSLFMGFYHFLHNRLVFFILCLVYNIMMIDTGDRAVGRDLDDVHAVDVAELLLLRQCGTGHTCFLLKLVKEVLECDRCQSLALSLDLHMLLRLNRLMKSV